jgi:hypothetical protein
MTAPRTFGSFKRLSIAVTIAALAAACGGGGGDGGSAPAPAPIPITDPLQPLLTGPGDPQNYVPTGGFDSWTYNSATSAMGTTQYELASVSIAGNKTVLGVSTTVFAERLFGDAPATPAYEMYYRKLPGGVAFYGNNDATDTLTAGVIPYVELLFPVAAGPVSSLTKTGIDFGMDLDGDGKNETVDATQTISITGFESVTVPAGTFPAAAKRLATITANAKLTSNGQVIPVTTNETTWIAPGAGVIRRHTVGSSQGSTILTNTIEARGFHVGGVRKGMSNPEEVMGSNFGVLTQTNVGDLPDPVDTPAAASSGTTFLVLGKAYTVDALTNKWLLRRMGYLRLPDGPNASLPSVIDIGPPVLSNDTREALSLAFGAGTYLAVFEQRNPVAPNIFGPTQPSVVAHRISANGVLTDAAPLVLLPQGIAPAAPGVTSRHPSVAYGGGAFLVIYYGGPATSSSTYIEGRFVAPDGTLGTQFRISPDFSYSAITPSVVFDGANFIVAYGDATGWKLARVTPAGMVLDATGVVVQIPAGRIHMAASGSGVLIAWITSDGFVYARRFAPDLTALDGGPINVAGTAGTRVAVTTAHFDGEFVVAWSQPLGPMNSRQWVVYLQRVAPDGSVRGLTPPPNALPGLVYSSLASSIPPVPSNNYVGGYTLPAFGSSASAGILVYVSGTSNGLSVSERASGIQGVWVHPFAR